MAAMSPQVSQRLRRIQSALGVTTDGMLGPETLTALEARLDIGATRKAMSLACSCKSLELILQFEIGSRAQYERLYAFPTWPGGESGVTIGIGYDLGFTAKTQIEADWDPYLEKPERAALAAVQGVKGAGAQQLARGLRHIKIPLSAAEPVFYASTLPRFARITRDAFSGVEKLPPDAQGALLSLVFNRGASLAGERRIEMRAIRDELAGGRASLERIAVMFEDMQRLWPDARGLRERRVREAALIRGARRRYLAGERVDV
jgi:hypothetical protein